MTESMDVFYAPTSTTYHYHRTCPHLDRAKSNISTTEEGTLELRVCKWCQKRKRGKPRIIIDAQSTGTD